MPLQRIYGLCAIFTLLQLCILGKAFHLQVFKGKQFSEIAENRLLRHRTISTKRGDITDRHGNVLATDQASFNLTFIPRDIDEIEPIITDKGFRDVPLDEAMEILGDALRRSDQVRSIVDALDMPYMFIEKSFLKELKKITGKKNKYGDTIVEKYPWSELTLVTDLDLKTVLRCETLIGFDKAFAIQPTTRRHYPHKKFASHILGYMTKVTHEEWTNNKNDYSHAEQFVGRSGIEGYYEKWIGGQPGSQLAQKQIDEDSGKWTTIVLRETPAVKGKDLALTINMKMQKLCEQVISNRRASGIIMDPYNGEILALASNPGFDPNVFVAPRRRAKERVALLTSPSNPLINRALQAYVPGSVFKVVTGLAAMKNKAITKHSIYNCSGVYRIGKFQFRCWIYRKYGMGHGDMTFSDALKNSCNPFFYQVSHKLGIGKLSAYGSQLGLGKTTGIDLPYEKRGFMPSKASKRKRFKQTWYQGDTLHTSIGQGLLLVTPAQVARYISAVANGGYAVTPHVNLEKTKVVTDKKTLIINPSFIPTVREGMYRVVNESGGTAKRYAPDGIPEEMSGKTSTAQTGGSKKPHAWFAGFYPSDKPKICFVFMAEFSGSGGEICGSMAKQFLERMYGSVSSEE